MLTHKESLQNPKYCETLFRITVAIALIIPISLTPNIWIPLLSQTHSFTATRLALSNTYSLFVDRIVRSLADFAT